MKTLRMMNKSDKNIEALRQAVEGLHHCKAKYKEKTHVKETFEGSLVWEGDVYLFDMKDHPTAKLAYVWSSPIKGSTKRKFYAVLHTDPVKSAQDAVRASIAKDYQDSEEE
ncbi:MAG TPA: hypothetical protein VLX61_04265 [Anaerolineales bacterium]|nr:hypothetical protein [Anaerolineales bacterium]